MTKYTTQKLGDICRIEKGRTGIASAIPGEYPLVVTAEERKTCSTYQFDCEAVCIPLVSSSGHGKKSLKNVHYQSGKFALGSILCAVIPNNPQKVNARYLHQYLQFYKDTLLVPLMKGAANVSLSMRDIANVEVSLPDFDTQTALAKIFVEAQEKQKPLNAEFEKQAEYAKRLRQNILQEAIEGKLTAKWRKQNPAVKGNPDFDAEALFEQIQKEKEGNSQQARKCVASSEAFPCGRTSLRPTPSADSNAARNARSDDDQPFEIPDSWKWVRLGEIIEYTDNLDIQKKCKPTDFIKYVDIDSIDNENYKIDSYKEKTVSELSSRARRILKKDFIIYSTVRPYLCNLAIIENDYENYIGSTGFNVFKPIIADIKFVFYFFLTNYVIRLYKSMMQGFNSPSINNSQFENTLFPLPPLAEQKEIVAKVESLLAKVTGLENQIQERKKLSGLLMQTILKNAFAPQK